MPKGCGNLRLQTYNVCKLVYEKIMCENFQREKRGRKRKLGNAIAYFYGLLKIEPDEVRLAGGVCLYPPGIVTTFRLRFSICRHSDFN